ncbi:AIPR family protein [Arthrobacter sp. H14-L1]|uniref:AIPR family protein n=1 Tax=Arthrobacter sp. H14-L1 TaxID=2996697 RepID=UPI00226F507B|nr:AIPR family protein [Arthrobacter sp. H14-L1]MCY0903622.1 AIPR family protein [Arthrobacter sp. H14-L1]
MSIEVDDLRNEIKVEAVAGDGAFEIAAFAAVFARRLEDAEAAADLNVEPLRCNGPRRKRLELLGYAESPIEQSLVILAGRYFGRDATLTMTDAKDAIGRATGFIEAAVDGWLTTNLEMSSREWEYADYFSKQVAGNKIARIRVILITDGLMSGRIRTIESGTVAGLKTSYEIWDQRRIIDATLPERGSEDIRVDFTKWLSDGLPCLVAPSNDETTRTYLAVIPARVLADVFDEYGSLLLESNVRTFLSARGQVNRGIQSTLAQEPARFLAYNNGLTTTASEVELGRSPDGPTIRSLDRWQIVNGGQTTASIAHFLRNNKSEDIIDEVSIQMKLVTVSESDSATVVQAVAKYANSQNRVSAADLFSTHEFHIRMEQISRRLKAPAKEGQQYQTGWFYERARGQWENDRTARGSAGEQAKFEVEYPKTQRITKTDWAKYDYCWNQHPDLVSKGAQSVFADYATKVDTQWTKDYGKGADAYGDGYFRTGTGKAILYETLRSQVLKQDWYKAAPGYLANIVAYAISRFAHEIGVRFRGANFDFGRVWQRQAISDSTLTALIEIAHAAQQHLTDPSRPQANVTQWAKQQACWEEFKKVSVRLEGGIGNDLVTGDEARGQATDDRKQRAMDTGFEVVKRVLAIKPQVWETVHRAQVPMSPTEKDLVQMFGLRQGKVPSDRQGAVLLRLLGRMAESGIIGSDSY